LKGDVLMADLTISLPRPCGENWDNMAERGCNRHCGACDKTIRDLSQLSADEVEALLANKEKVCVRAQIDADGTVLTVGGAMVSRRIKAVVGASLSLAVAACQHGAVTPLYVISGVADARMAVRVRGDNGTEKTVHSDGRGHFKIPNLRSGNYVLTTWAWCGGQELTVPGIQVGKTNVDIGTVESNSDDCIIVGVMERADPPQG
jgi:hypothetical protein